MCSFAPRHICSLPASDELRSYDARWIIAKFSGMDAHGGGEARVSDASDGRAFLLHKAKRKITARAVACTADTSRLLEEVASVANLARALLNVVRNNQGWTGRRSRTRSGMLRRSSPSCVMHC